MGRPFDKGAEIVEQPDVAEDYEMPSGGLGTPDVEEDEEGKSPGPEPVYAPNVVAIMPVYREQVLVPIGEHVIGFSAEETDVLRALDTRYLYLVKALLEDSLHRVEKEIETR